jgi:TPR repeat protein
MNGDKTFDLQDVGFIDNFFEKICCGFIANFFYFFFQSHAIAQFNLGVCYANGVGVLKNEKKASEFYEQAANQGHGDAKIQLEISQKKLYNLIY